MDINRETVNQWLDSGPAERDRQWLADKCGVKVSAVGNWLNKKGEARPIPIEHQVTIRKLMDEDAAKAETKPPHNLVLEFDDRDYAEIEQAALHEGLTIREWAKRRLNELADLDVEPLAASLDPSIARFPAPSQVGEHPARRASGAHLMAAAGSPINAEMIESHEGGDTVKVRISGLSMDPLFSDGDIVTGLLKHACRSRAWKRGYVYLVSYEGGLTVKRYNTRLATPEEIEAGISYVSPRDHKAKVRILESVNPAFPEIVIKSDVDWIAWIDTKASPSERQ